MQGGGMDEHSVQIENDCLIFLHKVKASLPILTHFEKLPGGAGGGGQSQLLCN